MEIKMILFLWGLLIAIPSATCYCFHAELKVEKTVSGSTLFYCEYRNGDPNTHGVIKLLPGSRFYLASDCLECACSGVSGLSCCGFGSHAGTTPPAPEGCKKIPDGCTELTVRKNNESLDCATGKPITELHRSSIHPDNLFSTKSAEEYEQSIITKAEFKKAKIQEQKKLADRNNATGLSVTPEVVPNGGKGEVEISLAKTWNNLVSGGTILENTPEVGRPVVDIFRDFFPSRMTDSRSWDVITRVTPTSRSWSSELRTVPRVQNVQHQAVHPLHVHPMTPFIHDFLFPFLMSE